MFKAAPAYVLTSDIGTVFIVPPSLMMIPSPSAIVILEPTEVPPSRRLSSVVVAVMSSRTLISAGVAEIVVVETAANGIKKPDAFAI